MVRIIADSTCDLSQDLLEKYNIRILPLHILLGEEEYEDGKNMEEFTEFQNKRRLTIPPRTVIVLEAEMEGKVELEVPEEWEPVYDAIL